MMENLAIRESSSEEKISEEAIREELSRILESSIFIQSDRLCRFLRFTVEATLAGEADVLKEYVIGTEVYHRKPPYHPSADSIVRAEARRLRAKLKEYYESLGKEDPVVIRYRPGSYVPVFQSRRRQDSHRTLTNAGPGELFIRIWRNVRTNEENGVQVEVQARVTNDEVQDDETASYAYDLLQRLASFAAKDSTSSERNFARETLSPSVPKPIPIKSRRTRATGGSPLLAVVTKVDRAKTC